VIYSSENLTKLTVAPCLPWEFVPAQPVGEHVKTDKEARQEWYQNSHTRHNFYTGLEGINPNQRVSKENPPCLLAWLIYDVDVALTDEEIARLIALLPLTPQYWERSLGGNQRLLFKLEVPVKVDSLEYAAFVLEKFQALLKIGKKFPGVDTAYKDPARLYCNGCEWHKVSDCVISSDTANAVLMEVSKEFSFKGATGVIIPLDAVERELRAKYPNFDWPGPFEAETQGPSFWIPESQSPKSAIVKPEGMFTFSGHAAQPFYSWADLLGADFAQNFQAKAVAGAAKNVFYDGKLYYYRLSKNGKPSRMFSNSSDDFRLRLRTVYGIPSKPDKNGISLQDQILSHVQENHRVCGVKPFLLDPNPIVTIGEDDYINLYERKPVKPAAEPATWGADGQFPFLSKILDRLFDPQEQLEWLLAWFKVYYQAALAGKPCPGQIVFIAGAPSTGKSLVTRYVLALAVGGFADGAKFVTGKDQFGGEMFLEPMWCIDDELISATEADKTALAGMLKKVSANSEFTYNQKFIPASKVRWQGRVTITLNTDFVAARALVPLDESTEDKYAFLRASQVKFNDWQDTATIAATIARELPFFLRWLVDWTIPAHLTGDARFTIKSYHHPSMLEMSKTSGRESTFREVLDMVFAEYFKGSDADHWTGTAAMLQVLIGQNPVMQDILRSLRVEQMSRYLELLNREHYLRMSCAVIEGSRRWTFLRPDKWVKPIKKSNRPPTQEFSEP
jgi:hypothetical protein